MVEWIKIENLGSYFGGLIGKTKEDFVDGNAKFITYMNVFTNPALDISTTGVVRRFNGEIYYLQVPLKLLKKQVCLAS